MNARRITPSTVKPLGIACFALFVSFAAVGQSAPQSSTVLVAGVPVDATQRAGEVASYTFDAQAGKIYLIEVDQRGLDFAVTVEGAGTSNSYNSPLRRDESELVIVDAPRDERYRVTISSDEPTDASGAYQVRLQPVDETNASDPRLLGAWRLMSNAAAASAAAEPARAEEARNLYSAAAALWEQLGQPRRQAQALYSAGMLEYWQLENWDGAVEYADKAAQLYQRLGELRLYADTLLLRGYAQIETANSFEPVTKESVFGRALATFDEALQIHERIGNDFGKAHVLNFIGITHWSRANRAVDDFGAARHSYNESAELFSRLGEWREELNVLQNIVVIDNFEGKSLQAIASFERILGRLPPGRDTKLRADILSNLGLAHLAFGNVDEALRLQSDSYALCQSIQDRTGQGYALKSLGEIYFAFGDLGGAKRYLEQAQVFAAATNDFGTQAAIQSSLGNVAFSASDYVTAIDRHRKAVELSASSEGRARRQIFLAKDLAAVGRHEDAIATARLAWGESRSELVRADALLQAAVSYVARGETSLALEALGDAREVYEKLQLTARQGDVLHAYSLAARADGDAESALAYGRDALDRVESLRERVAHPELRALNSATRRAYYEDQIDLLMQLHGASGAQQSQYLLEALSVDERSRARLTLDLLGEAAVDLDQGMSPELRTRRRALYAALAEKRQQQERENSPEVAQRLSAEMTKLETEVALLETEYRRAQPSYGRSDSGRTLDAKEIQAQLHSDTILLQYALGETRSYVWAVTSESIRGFALPSRAVIEEAARAAHSELGKAPGLRVSHRLDAALAQLSEYVLRDVADLAAAKPRVLVAADGALQYIPFGVLPIPNPAATAAGRIPLISSLQDREIIAVASMSASSAAPRAPKTNSSAKSIAIFADPVMEETDDRFRGALASNSPLDTDPIATRSSTGPSLPRLPYTGREAQAIAALLPNAGNLVAVGFDANLDTVLGTDLRPYRYIHFATHGVVDSEHPSLSALALSQFDAQHQRRAGYLRLYDIYTLHLDADVVVLSACETALGREIRGESLMGLTQGFLYAGARNVVASLWQVSDSATSELMTRFYRLLSSDDLSPAQALAAAQRSMVEERTRSDPYFWGAFVIQGQ